MFTQQGINSAARRNGWAKPQIPTLPLHLPALGMEKPPGQPSAKSQWDSVAQGCQDPPEAGAGKVLRDRDFTSTLPTLHCAKNGGN